MSLPPHSHYLVGVPLSSATVEHAIDKGSQFRGTANPAGTIVVALLHANVHRDAGGRRPRGRPARHDGGKTRPATTNSTSPLSCVPPLTWNESNTPPNH